MLESDKRYYDRVGYYSKIEGLKNIITEEKISSEAISINLSSVGMAFIMKDNQIEIDDMISFTLYLDNIPYESMAKVIRVRKAGEYFEIGIEFINFNNRFYKGIKDYLKNFDI